MAATHGDDEPAAAAMPSSASAVSARTRSGLPQGAFSSADGASSWNAASRNAKRSTASAASVPAASRSEKSAPAANWRMRTAYSIGAPSPSKRGACGSPRIATTSR